MSHGTGVEPPRIGRLTDLLVPALTLLVGLPAWRIGVIALDGVNAHLQASMLRNGALSSDVIGRLWLAIGLLALPLGGLLAARLLARPFGPPRVMAGAAALLAAARLAAQLGGPSWAPWFALAGVPLLVGALTVWPRAVSSPRLVLHGLLLGWTLHLAERSLSGTVDLAWQSGWGAFLLTLAGTVPLLVLGGLVAMQPWTQPAPRPAPTGLAVPLLVVLSVGLVGHPAALADELAITLPAAELLLALGQLGAVVLALAADGLLVAQLSRRGEGHRPFAFGWLTYQTVRITVVTAALIAALLVELGWSTAAGLLALTAAPAAAISFGAVLRTRPIGRLQPAGMWAEWLCWLLAVMLSLAISNGRWAIGLALAALVTLSSLALYYPEHPSRLGSVRQAVLPVVLQAVLLLGLLSWIGPQTVQAARRQARALATMPLGPARLVVLDAAGLRGIAGHQQLVAERRQLLAQRPAVVVVRETRPVRLRFDDPAGWLAQALDLPVYRRRDRPEVRLLSAVRPLALDALPGGSVVTGWATSTGTLGLAVVPPTGSPRAAAEALAAAERRLMVVATKPNGPTARVQPSGLRELVRETNADRLQRLLGSPSVRALEAATLTLQGRTLGLSVLLDLQPLPPDGRLTP